MWHQIAVEEALKQANSRQQGLNDQEIAERQKIHGYNQLLQKKPVTPWKIFFGQFRDFMILILLIAAIISGIIGDLADTIIILVIVFLNALIGFVQEYQAEKSMDALKKMSTTQTMCMRSASPFLVPSTELVPGDIVLLEAGNIIPADLRLMEAHRLQVNESALTGESIPVTKITAALTVEHANVPLGDRFNMAYKGSMVVNGRGRGVVIATGMQTEIGRIAGMLQQREMDTPLKRRMADFGRKLSYIILGICILLYIVGLLRGEGPLEMLLISISLAVAAIPEALPALINIALANGAKRLMISKALIRKLPAVETLGSVSHICTDKTGTLTLNQMTVVDLHMVNTASAQFSVSPLLMAMILNHDVKAGQDGNFMGDPTEIAIVEKASKELSPEVIEELASLERIAELPFDSGRKCMTTLHPFHGQILVLTKGAIESIISHAVLDEHVEQATRIASAWAQKGMRVLAFGYKLIDKVPAQLSLGDVEDDLIFSGMVALIDPPREQVKMAIAECQSAGITAVMITGDHPETARAIAVDLGILINQEQLMTGEVLSTMEDEVLRKEVEKIRVYARVSPAEKLRIVKALQAQGHFVAMTGDGVNDAPSLKAADIGVSMGINGTDVSKEASDMVLLDDNFATIVRAVREGRRIYDNIRKFVKYIMTCNSAEMLTIFIAPLIGLPMPLLPIHILWINLVTDGLPGLALANEQADPGIMKRPPRPSGESLFARGIGMHIIWVGFLMAAVTLMTQYISLKYFPEHWQTIVFSTLSFTQLAHILAIRSERHFLAQQGIFSNLPLLGAVLWTFLLQLGVIYWQPANEWFHTYPLSLAELLFSMVGAVLLFHAVELEKWIRRRVYQ